MWPSGLVLRAVFTDESARHLLAGGELVKQWKQWNVFPCKRVLLLESGIKVSHILGGGTKTSKIKSIRDFPGSPLG